MLTVREKVLCALIAAVICLSSTTTVVVNAFAVPSSQNQRRIFRASTRQRQYHVSTSSSSARSSLSMHFGHSHAHSHHHRESHVATTTTSKKTWKERLLQFVPKRRESGRIAFAALVTLIPALLFRRSSSTTGALTGGGKAIGSIAAVMMGRWRRIDWIAFCGLSACLTLSDTIRSQVNSMIGKIQAITTNIQKHAPKERIQIWQNQAVRVTMIGVALNLWLSIGKFVVGITAHSAALIADAAHSLSDLFSDGITLFAVELGRLPPDDDHPYGHGKYEAIGSLFLALTLLGTGFMVGLSSYKMLLENLMAGIASTKVAARAPSPPALVMALVSILSKEWLFRITKAVGDRLNSQVVIANAWHHRSDAYSSVLALASIAMARMGWLAADAAAGLLVGGMIGMTGFEILGESIKQLTDTNEEELVHSVTQTLVDAAEVDVKDIVSVRARQVGSTARVDVDVTTPEGLQMSASALRTMEERLKWQILTSVEGVGEVTVHATEGGGVVCPLLTATTLSTTASSGASTAHDHEHHHDHDEGHDHHHDSSHADDEADTKQELTTTRKHKEASSPSSFMTVKQVQDEVRRRLPGLSIPTIIVKYQDTVLVHVDVAVQWKADQSDWSVADAQRQAQTWKTTLEASPDIEKAHLYLDMEDESTILSPSVLGSIATATRTTTTFAPSSNNTASITFSNGQIMQ